MIERGGVYWAEPGQSRDRFPVVVIQSDAFNRSRIPTVVVVPLAANARLADAPGNVPVSARESGLDRDAVANVAQVLTLEKRMLRPTGAKLGGSLTRIEEGIRLVMGS